MERAHLGRVRIGALELQGDVLVTDRVDDDLTGIVGSRTNSAWGIETHSRNTASDRHGIEEVVRFATNRQAGDGRTKRQR